jgi:hypothetical protein
MERRADFLHHVKGDSFNKAEAADKLSKCKVSCKAGSVVTTLRKLLEISRIFS